MTEQIITMTPRKMAWMTIGLFIGYQIFLFWIWESLPQYQIFINRFSWSSADALAISGLVISNYVYWKTFKSITAPEATFMKDVFSELHKAGITSQMVGIIIKAQYGDRIKLINEKLKNGKLTEEELVEFLKE